MNKKQLCGWLLATLVLPGCATVDLQKPTPVTQASLVTPLVEKIENLTATGYAVVSVQSHKIPAQQRLMAIRASKLEAYRALTEQVYGLQLDANSTVADMMVTHDTFRSKVQGIIYGATLVSITPVSEDTYETTLSLDKSVVKELRQAYISQMANRAR
jgi:outer membrane protein FlgP